MVLKELVQKWKCYAHLLIVEAHHYSVGDFTPAKSDETPAGVCWTASNSECSHLIKKLLHRPQSSLLTVGNLMLT